MRGTATLRRVVVTGAGALMVLASLAACWADVPPDVGGTWIMLQVTTDIVDYPVVGRRVRETYLVLLLQVEQSGTQLSVREMHCLAHVDAGTALVRTEIPEAFLQSLNGLERSAVLRQATGEWRFSLPWGSAVHGARLDDPQDPLPTDPGDSRVADDDGDGRPGVTVSVSILGFLSGEVYAVQRLRKHLEGSLVSPDRIEGLITWSNEQVVLAATNPLLMASGDAVVHPDRERSYFVALRVDDAFSCEELRSSWRSRFGL